MNIIVINLMFVSLPLREPNFLCIFVLRITPGPRVKFVDNEKYS